MGATFWTPEGDRATLQYHAKCRVDVPPTRQLHHLCWRNEDVHRLHTLFCQLSRERERVNYDDVPHILLSKIGILRVANLHEHND